jgi:lysozyme
MTIQTFDVTGAASAQGLDVSNFQGRFDWAGAKKNVPNLAFGIHRLTQGLGTPGTNSPDPDATWNHQQITAIGIDRGAYHFMDPREDGTKQANYFVTNLQKVGLRTTDILMLDNETAGSTPATTAQVARDFMNRLDQLCPHNPRGVYTFISFANEGNCAGLGHYDLWLAFPNLTAPAAPPPWLGSMFRFWQWGQRRGTDADAFMGTVSQLKTWINKFQPAPPPPALKPNPDGSFTMDGHTTLRSFAHAHGNTVLGVMLDTIKAKGGDLGPGQRDLFSALVNSGSVADEKIGQGTELWP